MQVLAMIVFKTIYLVSIVFFTAGSAEASAVSLNEFLQQVQESNPSIEASRLRALALKYKIDPSATLEDPFIAIGIDQIPFQGGGGEVRRYQVSQSLPFPGKLSARKNIAEERALSAEADADTLTRQIKVMAIQTFLKASYNLEALALNERIQKIIRETSQSAKARYKTGGASHHEWLLGKLELATLDVEKLRLERQQKILYALLNELRNWPPQSPITIQLNEDLLTEYVESEMNLAFQPELRAWEFQEKSAMAELKLAKLSYAPDFVIQGMAMDPTMNSSAMGGQATWGVMVGVTIPLFFWRKQSELVSSARKDLMAVEAGKRALLNRLNTEVAEANEHLRTSVDVVALYKKDVIPLTELAVKNARSAYAAKTLSLAALLDALRSQRTQELELLAAKMDVYVAKTRLQELLSTPPIMRFAPARPTMFGGMGGAMNMTESSMEGSATINMGEGMSGPTRSQKLNETPDQSMGGMRGM
jgi:outer membrane protein, heavy metal efflux system